MRRVLLGDLVTLADLLATGWGGDPARLLDEAHAAHRYMRRFGRPHPRWGGGSLMARALADGPPAQAGRDGFLRALAMLCEAILERPRLSVPSVPDVLHLGKRNGGPIMAETKPKVTPVDPVWQRICDEAQDAIRSEPLLGGLIHSSLLHHPSMERALAYRFSLKLASGNTHGT